MWAWSRSFAFDIFIVDKKTQGQINIAGDERAVVTFNAVCRV
jgi:hypothetical protein